MQEYPAPLPRSADAAEDAGQTRARPAAAARPLGPHGEIARAEADERVCRVERGDHDLPGRAWTARGGRLRIEQFDDHFILDVHTGLRAALEPDRPQIGGPIPLADPDPELCFQATA